MAKIDQRQKALSKEYSKIRVLAVAKMLNEGRKITATEILRRLDLQYGIQARRATIFADIYAVDKFIPIEATTGRNGGFKKMNFAWEGTADGKG